MDKIKVLLAAIEAAPLVKVGGLADVIGSLPSALNRLNCDARVIIPKYSFIDERKFGLEKFYSDFEVRSGGEIFLVNLWRTDSAIRGVRVYLIENDKFFGGPEVYSPEFARQESEKFLFFSLATLETLPLLDFYPDIIHCHDFHTGLIPALLKTSRYSLPQAVKTIFTIHNFEYQGRTVPDILPLANLNEESLASLARDAQDGDINFMVQGIINADLVTTVSPSYAQEITTKEFAAGLAKITRGYRGKIKGILNGIDTVFFDPATDPALKKNYSWNHPQGKADNKEFLQKKFGLPRRSDIPLVGFISRLFEQKGLGLLGEELAGLDAQFVFLGQGDKKYEDKLQELSDRCPEKIAVAIGFDSDLAKQIYAGADIFLMPSLFEPCGLGQMIAARYGTIPVVRRVGGLRDSINSQLGFSFKGFSEKDLLFCLGKAVKTYKKDKKNWLKLQKNCFTKDFSWSESAKKYLSLYKQLLG